VERYQQVGRHLNTFGGVGTFFRDHFQKLTGLPKEQILWVDLGQVQCDV
jgi:hypothetical protein